MARDEDLSLLEDLAERMGMEGESLDNFVNNGMRKLGYKPRMDWDEPEGDGDGNNVDDMFGGGTRKRTQRPVNQRGGSQRQQQGGGRRASGGDWQYDS